MRQFNQLEKLQSFTDAEIAHLSQPTVHKMHVHERKSFVLIGLMLLVSFSTMQSPLYGSGIFVLVVFVVYMFFLPCKCGKHPVLKAKARIILPQQVAGKSLMLVLRDTICGVLAIYGFSYAFVSIARGTGNQWLINLVISSGFTLIGFVGLIFSCAGLFDLLGPLKLSTSLSDSELKDFNFENDQNDCAEQWKLVSLLMKMGNFEDADTLSKRLLQDSLDCREPKPS